MKSNNYLSLLCPYWAVILLLIFTSCTSQQIASKNDDSNIPLAAARKIFKKVYNDDSGVEYDSSYTVGNCVIYKFLRSVRPRPHVVELAVDSLNNVYDIYDRHDLGSMVLNNNFRLADVNEMNKYLKIYFSSHYYDFQNDSSVLFKPFIKYKGAYIESKDALIDELKCAYLMGQLTCDSLAQILPPINPLIIQCIDDGCIYEGSFIDVRTLKLFLIKMKVYKNGLINVLEERKMLDIEKTIGKLQEIPIM